MSPHILSGRHHHDDDEFEVPLSENWLWKSNNFSLVSAGIDIGSSSTLVLLMRINIKKSGSGRYAKFKVVSRELVYESPVNFTPYKHGGLIDSEKIRKIISAAFSGAGVTKDSIDVGALILTGEAMRSENSSEIGRSLSLDSGRFISVNAGHKLESVLAAHGSGAVDESIRSGSTVLNIDIGGGTTKYALVSRGQILASWALSIGGRLVLFNRDGFVEKVT
ncbi:MAG TPA: ethanolamine ammonia-lyase reactivating factor EutA, partial [Thermoplasmataceae archaeon]|nr:ethanolamine ammonia-lyase reactivating factor EutA [Thermoplasmataceae archaeon]